VYTVVYTLDVTDRPGPGDGVEVQVGVGAKETVPNEAWVWSSCTFNIDTDGGAEGDRANDEFVGQFVSPAVPGAYAFSARTRIDGGAWLLCDLGGDSCEGAGSDDGYSPLTAGEVLVSGP
jgi:hypothetical protein